MPQPPKADAARFVVRTLNLLAREFTKYNARFHGHRESQEREAVWQTRQRYMLSAAGLLTSNADAVCLQECAPGFFSSEHNQLAADLLELYEVHSCYGAGERPGTAVLLKKTSGRLHIARDVEPLSIQSSDFGGSSKSACAVPVHLGAEPDVMWVVSAHLSHKANERAAHLKAIGDAVGPEARVLLMGDFNARRDQLDEPQRSWLQTLTHVSNGQPTGLSGDFAVPVEIDHVFYGGLGHLMPQLSREKAPAAPYRTCTSRAGRATVVGGSDHVWLDAAFFDRRERARTLVDIYQAPYRPPAWALEWASGGGFEAVARQACAFTLDERAQDVRAVLSRREPVNIGMSRPFDKEAMRAAFGWDRAGYETLYEQSAAEGQPRLPPNLAVFCQTPVEGPDGPCADVINVTGFAFDNVKQVDHKYFIGGGRLGELTSRLQDMFSLVFACARHRDRSTVVLSLVGAGAFSAGFPGGPQAYKRDHLFPGLAAAWAALPAEARPDRVGLMGNPSADDASQVAAACRGATFLRCGHIPQILHEEPDALFVNAWDPNSVVGNGNGADQSLDGYFGRNTAMQFLSLPAINPFLRVLRADEVRALLR